MSGVSKEAIEGIKGIGKDVATKHIEEPIEIAGKADKAHFDTLMEQKRASEIAANREVPGDIAKSGSPLQDVAKSQGKIDPALEHSSEEIRSSIQKVVSNIKEVQEDLKTPQLNVKPYQGLMRGKLHHIDDQLRIAFTKMGKEFPATGTEEAGPVASTHFNPIEEFLGRLSHIDYQMENMGSYLEFMGKDGRELNPANMLAIQMKVNHIGQEVEFFGALLTQALNAIKTTLNVQV